MVLYQTYELGGKGYRRLLKQALKNSERNWTKLAKGVREVLEIAIQQPVKTVATVKGFTEGLISKTPIEELVVQGTAPMSNAEFKRYRTVQRLMGRSMNEDLSSTKFIQDILAADLTDEEVRAITGGVPKDRLKAILGGAEKFEKIDRVAETTGEVPGFMVGPGRLYDMHTPRPSSSGETGRVVQEERRALEERLREMSNRVSNWEITPVDNTVSGPFVGGSDRAGVSYTHGKRFPTIGHIQRGARVSEGCEWGRQCGNRLRGIFVSKETPKGILPFKNTNGMHVENMIGNMTQHTGQTAEDIVKGIRGVKTMFRESKPGIYRSAGSLSDNSLMNTYFTLQSLAKDPTNKVFFEGYAPLNSMGRLSMAGAPKEDILRFVNTGLKKLTFGGFEAPAAKMGTSGEILYPSLVIQKTK